MVASQNGWIANRRDRVASQLVPGTNVRLTVRKDAPGLLLLEVASAFDRLVEDIDNARGALDDWGYAERPIRGGSALSNHASGTAIDLNAPRHPLGAVGTFTPAQVARILEIIAVTGGVVRWGGQYKGRKDEMHFEINDGMSMADCEHALAAMRLFNGRSDGPIVPLEDLMPANAWDAPEIPDFYAPNLPPLPNPGVALGWATAHAAHARDRATEARDLAGQARDIAAANGRKLDAVLMALGRIEARVEQGEVPELRAELAAALAEIGPFHLSMKGSADE